MLMSEDYWYFYQNHILSPKKRTILVIDDDINCCLMVKKMFEKNSKIRVRYTLNTPDGLEEARNIKPDLILLDLNLPHMNGYDAMANLKNNVHTKSIPVALYTSETYESAGAKGFNGGADAIFVKSIEPRRLHREIKNLLKLIYG